MSTMMDTFYDSMYNAKFFDDSDVVPSPFDTLGEDWQQTLDEIVQYPTREEEEDEYSSDEDDTEPLEQSSIPVIHENQEKQLHTYIPISDEFARIYTQWYKGLSFTKAKTLPNTYNTLSSRGYFWNTNPWKFLNDSIDCIDGWLSDNDDEENWDMVENIIKLYDFYFEIRDNLIYLDE